MNVAHATDEPCLCSTRNIAAAIACTQALVKRAPSDPSAQPQCTNQCRHSLALDAHFLLRDEVLNDDVSHLVPVCIALMVQTCMRTV